MSRLDFGGAACGVCGLPSGEYNLLIWRGLAALWSVVFLIIGLIMQNISTVVNGVPGSPWWTWGIYIGNWSFFAMLIYFITGAYFTYRNTSGVGVSQKPSWWEKWMWVNYEVAWSLSWASTFGYWIVIRSDCTFAPHNCANVSVYEYNAFGINLIVLLIDMLYNQFQWAWLHLVFTWLFTIVWFIFAAIWHGAVGVWPYSQQDNAVNGTMAFFFYPIILGATAFFHMCGFGCHLLLAKCYKNKNRVKKEDFFGDDTNKLGGCFG